jgi:MFS family permease
MKEPKIRVCYIYSLVLTVSTGFWILGYCFAYFNVMTKLLHDQYVYRGADVIEDRDLFNSIVSGLIPFGATFGSIIASPIAAKGRRFSLIVISITFIIGTGISLIFSIYALIIGRLIMGMCVGAYVTVWPLYVSEVTPTSISGTLGAFVQMGAASGILSGFLVSLVMPLPGTPSANTTGMWRIVFGFPSIVAFIQLLLLLFVFRYETPVFYKKIDDIENMEKSRSFIYYFDKVTEESAGIPSTPQIEPDINHNRECLDEELKIADEESIKESKFGQNMTAQQLSLQKTSSQLNAVLNQVKNEAEMNKRWPYHYKMALWVWIILSIFYQATGIDAVIFFSNQIFLNGEEGEGAEFRARIATVFIGSASFTGTVSSVIILRYLKRKTMLQVSEILMTISHILCALFSFLEIQIGVIIFTFTFVYSFNFGFGTVLWVYCSDVLDNFGCAVVGVINMFTTWFMVTFSNFGFKYLTPPGMYILLTIVQIISIIYIWVSVKETFGKTKEERERIYMKKLK